MNYWNKKSRNAIRILVIAVGVLLMLPTVYAQDVAQDFSYPLKGDWSALISGYLGFGEPNHGLFKGYHVG